MFVADHGSHFHGFAELIDSFVQQGVHAGAALAIADIFAGEPADELAPEAVVGAVLAHAAEGEIPEVSGIDGEGGGSALAVELDGQDDLRLGVGVNQKDLCAALGLWNDDVAAQWGKLFDAGFVADAEPVG